MFAEYKREYASSNGFSFSTNFEFNVVALKSSRRRSFTFAYIEREKDYLSLSARKKFPREEKFWCRHSPKTLIYSVYFLILGACSHLLICSRLITPIYLAVGVWYFSPGFSAFDEFSRSQKLLLPIWTGRR